MNTIVMKQKFKKLARLGYASRGIIYLVIGGLAIMAALGMGSGETTGSRGAIRTILEQPFGSVMIAVLIVGLICYSLWRLVQSVGDADGHGTSVKGLGVRFGLFASAVTHTLLAVFAARLLLGNGSTESGASSSAQQTWINSEFAQLGLTVFGVALIITGLAHLYKGWTAKFEKYMEIPVSQKRWARPLCQFGLMARGVVWGIIGWFLINSASQASSGEIHGLEQALDALRSHGYGPWLLGVVAAGLFAFGVYSILEAIYRRIDTDSEA